MIKLQEISVPGCAECVQFEKMWEQIKGAFPNVEKETVDATTERGQQLVAQYGIMAAPGIVINGELFSVGGVNKNVLIKKLTELNKGQSS
jgi:glutaredoxin